MWFICVIVFFRSLQISLVCSTCSFFILWSHRSAGPAGFSVLKSSDNYWLDVLLRCTWRACVARRLGLLGCAMQNDWAPEQGPQPSLL